MFAILLTTLFCFGAMANAAPLDKYSVVEMAHGLGLDISDSEYMVDTRGLKDPGDSTDTQYSTDIEVDTGDSNSKSVPDTNVEKNGYENLLELDDYVVPISKSKNTRNRRYIHESTTTGPRKDPGFYTIPDFYNCETGEAPNTLQHISNSYVDQNPNIDQIAYKLGNFAHVNYGKKCISGRCSFVIEILSIICIPEDYEGGSGGVFPLSRMPKVVPPRSGSEPGHKALPIWWIVMVFYSLALAIERPFSSLGGLFV